MPELPSRIIHDLNLITSSLSVFRSIYMEILERDITNLEMISEMRSQTQQLHTFSADRIAELSKYETTLNTDEKYLELMSFIFKVEKELIKISEKHFFSIEDVSWLEQRTALIIRLCAPAIEICNRLKLQS